MADDDKKGFTLVVLPEALEDLNEKSKTDPEAAAVMREMLANMRQAVEGVNSGKYATIEDGVEAISGQRPHLVNIDEDDDEDDTDPLGKAV